MKIIYYVYSDLNISIRPTTQIQTRMPPIKKDKSTDCCHSTFDSTNDVVDENSEEKENTMNGNGWTSIRRPGQKTPEGLSAVVSQGDSDGFPFGFEVHNSLPSQDYDDTADSVKQFNGLNQYYSPTYGIYYGTQQIPEPDGITIGSSVTQSPQLLNMSTIQSTTSTSLVAMSKIIWKRIALLALSTVGLTTLYVIAPLKILFFLLFKVKYLLTVKFFKLLLLLNFFIFFNFQLLPLFVLPFFSIFT